MRICLLSLTYPPSSTDGIPRQRQMLAQALGRQGHDVHVVTCGSKTATRHESGVTIHEVAVETLEHYHDRFAGLDDALTHSQRLFEGLVALARSKPFDIVDVPMWMAQGFVTLHRYPGPTVIWLQTTYAQLLTINNQPRTPLDQALIDLERACLERADGVLGDSQVAFAAIYADYTTQLRGHQAIAYIGIPPVTAQPDRVQADSIELLIVGRLEQRKGTPLLFELLPSLLQQQPHLRVRFVGRDNSSSDGWYARHHAGYAEVFQRRYAQLADRVLFEGHVDEDTLLRRYAEADILLVPSAYESFGIVYLEAMRVGLPVIAFAAGGAVEIFAAGEDHGAVLVPAGDTSRFAAAILRVASDAALRSHLGACGQRRFLAAFSDEIMATATSAYYQQVIEIYRDTRLANKTIYHVAAALYSADAVSAIALRNAHILGEFGYPPTVLTRQYPDALRDQVDRLDRILEQPASSMIMHYSGYQVAIWALDAVCGRKAIHYHNSTPADFFTAGSEMYHHQRMSYVQLRQIADRFDLLIGDTAYNITELSRYTTAAKPAVVLYPVIDPLALGQADYNQQLYDSLRAQHGPKILFVGRIAPNKRQDRLMKVLNHYCSLYDNQAQLWLIGNTAFDSEYQAELDSLRSSLRYADRIQIIGNVPDPTLYAYYRAADVFVCASEHEGFCVPIAEAMAFDLPVIAYASSAIPETMGGAGVLLADWDAAQIAEHIQQLCRDADLRAQIIQHQRQVLDRFSVTEARIRLAAIARFLEHGEMSPLFFETQV